MQESNKAIALSVVMITLNEEGSIARVVEGIKAVAPEAEVLVVDSSTDHTAEIATGSGCRVIRQLPAQGYGPALAQALHAARGSVIVTMDCDDTYPCEAIPRLVEKIQSGYDLVSASRLAHRPKAMPLMNYIANLAFARLAGIICGANVSDVHTGMRAYRKSLIDSFPFDGNGMALPVELAVGPIRSGFKHAEISIEYFERTGRSKLQPLEGTYWTLKRLWKWRQ